MNTSIDIKAKLRPHKYKKARYAIKNVIKKDLSKIIWKFEKLPYGIYERKRPKHESTDSYLYLTRYLAKCMMRDDNLNLNGYPLRTEITSMKQISTSHVCSTEESILKEFLVNKTLSQDCSTDKYE